MKKIEVVPMMAANGKPYMITERVGDEDKAHHANTAELVSFLCHSLPMQQMTMTDATHGTRVVRVAQEANGSMELEDADYSWLIQKTEEYGPRIFGINAFMLREAIGPTETRAARRAARR